MDRTAWTGLGVIGAVIALQISGASTLTGWSEFATPAAPFWVVASLYALTWLVARRLRGMRRTIALLSGSLACAVAFDPVFAACTVAWVLGLHAVMFHGGKAHPARGLAYALVTLAALAIACNRDLFPDFLEDHRELGRIGYLFALAFTLRIAWLLHEVRMRRQVMPRLDLVLFFTFAPMNVVMPYMMACIRCDRFRAALPVHDRDAERAGIRLVAWGCVLALVTYAMSFHDPTRALDAALRAHDVPAVALWSFAAYPIHQAVKVCAIAAILVGMIRMMGVPLAPSFDRPLAAQTVTELWRRWNTHFRDVLVELFYVPVAFRLRRKPERAIVVGCFHVFVIGSTLFHLPKHYLRVGSLMPPDLHILVENIVMGAIVAVALIRERRNPVAPPRPAIRIALRCLRTWAIWLGVVLFLSYGIQYAAFGEYTPAAIQPWR